MYFVFLYRAMLGCEELQKYDRARVFLDEDYTAADKFTVKLLTRRKTPGISSCYFSLGLHTHTNHNICIQICDVIYCVKCNTNILHKIKIL